MDLASGVPLTKYDLNVRVRGYESTIVANIPGTANFVEYRVITLQPRTEFPVWEDTFESDMGWSLVGHYHRQQYDPGIYDVSFDSDKKWLWTPPDDIYIGAIPETPDGSANYLWYGQEFYGNFIGEPDPINEVYGGGNSIADGAHQGSAISPEIDLTGYSSARVEFDMAWEIETQHPATFDEMRLYVNDEQVRLFNPFISPVTVSYTMSLAGYNRSIVWAFFEYDLSNYAGAPVNLTFSFWTNDELYNGCRGQFIDNVRVYAE